MSIGNEFQADGAETAKALSVNRRWVRGVMKSPLDLERSRLSVHRLHSSHKYNGTVPRETRYIKTHSLNLMWLLIGSQCNSLSSGWLGLLWRRKDSASDRPTNHFSPSRYAQLVSNGLGSALVWHKPLQPEYRHNDCTSLAALLVDRSVDMSHCQFVRLKAALVEIWSGKHTMLQN